jgi:hypothetical protein
MHEHSQHNRRPGGGRWVFWSFVLIAGYFLITEHRAHVIEFLPFVLLAACPLLHFFHGHGEHGRHGGQGDEDKGKKP